MEERSRGREPGDGVNIYLVGFMGVGKSAVGRSLARQLQMRFLDSDRSIEHFVGKAVADIFADEGEERFRELEREFVERGHPTRGVVVSCGGGLVVQDGMVERLQKRGLVYCLFASVETILARTQHNNRRPLLNVPDPGKRVKELLAKREAVYKQAGTGISTENRSIHEVVHHIVRHYEHHAPQFDFMAQSSNVQE